MGKALTAAQIGRLGGKARVANQTAEERRASAQNAARARWARWRAAKQTADPKESTT